MLFSKAIQEYLLECQLQNFTQKTIKGYRNNLEFFENYLKEYHQVTELDEITIPLMKQFIIWQDQKGRKATYINGQIKTLRAFFKFCQNEDYYHVDMKKIAWKKEQKTKIKTFRPSDVKKLLNHFTGSDFVDIRNKTILYTLFETGIRCQELCDIIPEDIKEGYILIRNGKNHKERVVPLTPILEKQLIKYIRCREKYIDCKRHDSQLFLSFHYKQLTVGAVEIIIRNAGKELGISNVRISPHTCRHFFAQQCVRNGMDVYSLSRLLGHESIAITQRYLQDLTDEDIVLKAVNKSVIMSIK